MANQVLAALNVLCSADELDEFNETIRVGDFISREAARREGSVYGGALDRVEWRFNKYASLIGYTSVIITGRVAVIKVIYVNLVQDDHGSWIYRPGSASLAELTVAGSCRPSDEVSRETPAVSEERDFEVRPTKDFRAPEEGEKRLDGWLLTLADARIQPKTEAI